MKMKWIKCSDMMPPNDDKVIIYGRCDTDWFIDDGWFKKDYKGAWSYKKEMKDKWILYSEECCRDEVFWDEVTHWMPFPEEPESRNE
jgi:Protein of unknown function (DUF551)